jgi:hypothetical protein
MRPKEYALRDKKICMLKTAGRSNIAIAKIVGASYRAVGNVLHRERQKGNIISHHSRPFNYALNLALADKQPLGKMADMCEFMGLDVIKWLWGSKPPDINFASYVGVVLKDMQLLHDSLIPMRKL